MMPSRAFAVSLSSILLLVCFQSIQLAAAEKVDPSGTWKWKREIEGTADESVLKLKLVDDKLTGLYKRGDLKSDIKNAKIEGDKLSFDVTGKYGDIEIEIKFEGKVEKDAINGRVVLSGGGQSGDFEWEAKRGLDFEDVEGKWQIRVETPDRVFEPVLVLNTDKDKKPAGTYQAEDFGDFKLEDIEIKDADLQFKIKAERDGNAFTIAYNVKPAGDAMKGKVKLTFGEGEFELDCTAKRIVEKKEEKKEDKKEATGETK